MSDGKTSINMLEEFNRTTLEVIGSVIIKIKYNINDKILKILIITDLSLRLLLEWI